MTKRLWTSIFASLGMLVLIIDTKTAVVAAQNGIKLCLMTVIPSLFPFFILSILLTSVLSGTRTGILAPLHKLLGVPDGAESMFLIGILGGYPTGAKAITDSYKAEKISKSTARRMLSFCSNAGPAFIFGIAAFAFPNQNAGWALWGIHILSAIFVALSIPKDPSEPVCTVNNESISITQALRQSILITAQVCGWILLFRVIIAFLFRWILWILPTWGQIFIIGILELANGCGSLMQIPSEGLRFLFCTGILGFGGLCVLMQTYSITGSLGIHSYLKGKLLQLLYSLLLGYLYQRIFLHDFIEIPPAYIGFFLLFTAIFIIFVRKKKKVIAFMRNIVYNNHNTLSRRQTYAVSKEN